tara:strand:+ start:152 stop:337 length:186 start_codon:yes stop_codon:yes gene_type:complete
MFKLEHNEALILIQVVEANSFAGKDVEVIAKLLGKIKREAIKTAPRVEQDVTEEWQGDGSF